MKQHEGYGGGGVTAPPHLVYFTAREEEFGHSPRVCVAGLRRCLRSEQRRTGAAAGRPRARTGTASGAWGRTLSASASAESPAAVERATWASEQWSRTVRAALMSPSTTAVWSRVSS